MTPPVTMLRSAEVFDAYEKAGSPMRISAPGRPVLVVSPDAAPDPSTAEAVASVREGLSAIETGDCLSARESVSRLRARYGL